jgi:hypothetical protein
VRCAAQRWRATKHVCSYREQLRREAAHTARVLESTGGMSARMERAATAAATLRAASSARRWGPSRRMGTWSTSADEIGFGLDDVKFSSPRRGKVSTMKQFLTPGHLGGPAAPI